MTYLKDGKGDGALKKYKIDAEQKFSNIVFVYRDKKVGTKLTDVSADKLEDLEAAVKKVVK